MTTYGLGFNIPAGRFSDPLDICTIVICDIDIAASASLQNNRGASNGRRVDCRFDSLSKPNKQQTICENSQNFS